MRTPRKPGKPRKSPRKPKMEEVAPKPQAKKVAKVVETEGDWKERMPHGNRKVEKFCVGCLVVETCIKQKLAAIMFCGDKQVK